MSVSSRIRMQVVPFCGTRGRGFGQHVHRQHQRQTWLTHHWCGQLLAAGPARRIAMYALFVALAMVTSFIEFPITPVTWLKYDPSGIVCLIAGFAYGPAAAAIVLCSALCRTCSPIRGVR